jgi:hypothetical protein
MGFKYVPGQLGTPLKNAVVSAVRVAIGGTGAVGTIEQSKAGFISGVVRVSAGLYRFTISGGAVPPRELVIIPAVASQTAAGSNRKAFYDNGTYTVTAFNTATFDVQVTDLNNAGPAAADPVSGDSLHVLIFAPRYTNG